MTAFRAINGIGLGIVQPLLFSLVADKSSVYGRGNAPSVDGSSTKNGWSKSVDEKNRPNWLTFFCETSFFAEFVGFSVFCQAFGFLLSTGSLGQTAFTAFATSVAPLQIGPMAGWQFALHLSWRQFGHHFHHAKHDRIQHNHAFPNIFLPSLLCICYRISLNFFVSAPRGLQDFNKPLWVVGSCIQCAH